MQVLKPYTTAQRLMLALGVDPYVLESHRKAGAINGKLPSSTKSGPGRRHADKTVRDTPAKKPAAPIGQPPVFLGQRTNPAKRARRDAIKAMGRRQYLKLAKGHDTFNALVA